MKVREKIKYIMAMEFPKPKPKKEIPVVKIISVLDSFDKKIDEALKLRYVN